MLAPQGVSLTVSEAARQWLAEKGYSEEYGARPLRRLVSKSLLNGISEVILSSRGHSDPAHLKCRDLVFISPL